MSTNENGTDGIKADGALVDERAAGGIGGNVSGAGLRRRAGRGRSWRAHRHRRRAR